MDGKRKGIDVTAKGKIERRKTRETEKATEGRGEGDKREGRSSTMLHYVRHFPEDSLGNENREDVGKRWGGGGAGTRGGAPNKYLTKSSGKLIPSFGVSYGEHLQPQPAVDALERIRRSISQFSSCDFASGSVGITTRRNPVTRAENTGTYYQSPGFS